jgi:drug/metabolite transporter (DMT)-like permease
VSPAHLALAIAVLAVSFAAIFIRLAESPALTIATNRMLASLVLLALPSAFFARRRLAALQRRDLAAMLLSGLLLAMHFGVWTLSLEFTSVASSVVFVTTSPVFVALAEWLWLKQPPSWGAWLGIVLALAGSLLVGAHDLRLGGAALWGDFLALFGALFIVGYLLIGRRLRQRLDFLTYSLPVYTVCWLTLLAWTTLIGLDVRAFPPLDAVWFFALALFATLGGHTLLNWALAHVPASLVAVTLVGEPVGAAILAWLILGEALSPLTGAGGLLILAGIYLTARAAPPKAREVASQVIV